MRIRELLFLGLFAALAPACGAANDIDADVDQIVEIEEGKSDLFGSPDYFTVRPDYRRCVYPLCGGFHITRANGKATRYVAELDFKRLGLDDSEQAELKNAIYTTGGVILRGTVRARTFPSFGNLGKLVATEGWRAAGTTEPKGGFYRVTDSGVRCITYPCPSYRRETLNVRRSEKNIAGVDLSGIGASDETVDAVFMQIDDQDGILVAGEPNKVTGPAGSAEGLAAAQAYTRVVHVAKPTCYVGGCSGQVCSDKPGVITTCEWREEYACYKSATCEVQADGQCGWTMTPELKACLNPAPPAKKCYVGGCSGQICSDQEGVISTCEWRPEYACYKTAACEVQADGECGWTMTPALTQCLGQN